MNRYGFTMIEILAAITIMGILSSMGIIAYSRYHDSSIKKAYNLYSQNVASAAEEYFMSNNKETSVSLSTLVGDGYLESDIDPNSKEDVCTGTVIAESSDISETAISSYTFKVTLNCSKYSGCKQYPGGSSC